MASMELGEHVMSESAVACTQSHNDHLVISEKEVVCVLSVVAETIFSPTSPFFFHK